MAPTLYMIHPGPPSRAVIMLAKAIDLDLNLKEVDFFNGEHLKPDYLKMNPQHTIPTLVDEDGFTIWDSHAIMIYLVSKYAKNDDLYPQNLQKRAVIDQRLHFESGVVFALFRRIARSILLEGKTTIEKKNLESVQESYQFLNTFLKDKCWVAGDFISIADYSLLSSIGVCNRIIPIDPSTCPFVLDWLKRCEQLPEYEVNKRGEQEMAELILNKIRNKF